MLERVLDCSCRGQFVSGRASFVGINSPKKYAYFPLEEYHSIQNDHGGRLLLANTIRAFNFFELGKEIYEIISQNPRTCQYAYRVTTKRVKGDERKMRRI